MELHKFLIAYSYHFEMEKKYGLHFASQSHKQGKLSFDYTYSGEKSISEARSLIHALVGDFLLQSSFTVDDLVISVAFLSREGEEDHLERKLSHVTLLEGEIYYSTYDPTKKAFKSITHEKF